MAAGRVGGPQAGKGEKYCCANQAESCGGRRIRKGPVHSLSAGSAVRAKLVELKVLTETAIDRLSPERQWVCNACSQAMIRRLRPSGTYVVHSCVYSIFRRGLTCLVFVHGVCVVPVSASVIVQSAPRQAAAAVTTPGRPCAQHGAVIIHQANVSWVVPFLALTV